MDYLSPPLYCSERPKPSTTTLTPHLKSRYFGRMIEQVQAPQSLAEERAEAKERKEKQLAEAEKDFQRSVK